MLTALLLSSAYAYTAVEDAMMSDTEYTVAGTFCPYDFADAPNAFDWAFTASDGRSYQLQGNAPTDDNVFGWKEVNITTPEPQWHMFQLKGDVDGDGSTKFDWVLVSANPDAPTVYKLDGVSESGNFEYSAKQNVDVNVTGNKVIVMHQAGQEDNANPEMTPSGDMNSSQVSMNDRNMTHEPIDLTQMPLYELNDVQKENLIFMYNEEKMARDVYLALNAVNPSKTLQNIALRAEQTHMDLVYGLIEKYDLDTQDLLSLAPNEFSLSSVQTLFDSLHERGLPSLQASLETGCMVEVTDINDLLTQMELIEGIEDIELVYENLLSGSYSHYWAFDNALKNLGVADGCCTLGDDFCKTSQEYPQVSHGNGH